MKTRKNDVSHAGRFIKGDSFIKTWDNGVLTIFFVFLLNSGTLPSGVNPVRPQLIKSKFWGFWEKEFVTAATAAATQAAKVSDNTVRCRFVLVPVSPPPELNIDQLRESAVIKPSPPLWRGCWGGRGRRRGQSCKLRGGIWVQYHSSLSPLQPLRTHSARCWEMAMSVYARVLRAGFRLSDRCFKQICDLCMSVRGFKQSVSAVTAIKTWLSQ